MMSRGSSNRAIELDDVSKSKGIRAALAILASVTFFGATAESHAESLRAVLKKTYQGNPTIRADRQRDRAAKEAVTQARAGWAPKVTLQVSKSIDVSARATRPDSPGRQSPTLSAGESVSIQLRKPLYDGGTNRQRVKQAKASVGASRQQSLSVEQQTLFAAVQAYVDVVRDRKILNQRQLNLRVLRELANATSKRFAVGEVTKTDVAQATARVSAARSTVEQARAQLAASEATYEKIIGSTAPRSIDWPAPARLPSSLQAALASAQKINPTILAAAFVEDAARHNKRAISAERDWQVDLSASVSGQVQGQVSPSKVASFGTAANVTLTASKSLYDGGLIASREHEASHIRSQRSIEKIVAVRQVRESVKTAWNSYKATVQGIAAARDQVSATQGALEGVRTEYTVGSRSTVDVLNVQQELVNAQITLITAQHSRILRSYELLAATGRLTGKALGL